MLRDWRAKVIVQFVLAHLPFGARLNYALQRYNEKHTSARIAMKVRGSARQMALLDTYKSIRGSTVVEIGTGWEPGRTIGFHFWGADRIHTYDHIRHVKLPLLQDVLHQFREQLGYEIGHVWGEAVDDIFSNANIVYNAPGDARHTELPEKSVDLIFSNAVLEHVPVETIHALTAEAKRILKDNGIAFHVIGCRDHYAFFDKRLSFGNYYKYPEWLWKTFCQNRIHYQNRLPACQYVNIFRSHGADIIDVRNKSETPIEILKQMKIDEKFSTFSLEDLAVTSSEVVFSF